MSKNIINFDKNALLVEIEQFDFNEICGDLDYLRTDEYRDMLEYFIFKLKVFNDDIDIVLAMVKKRGYFLKLASKRLKDNDDVVLTAVKNNSSALQYASERLRNDKEFIHKVLKIKTSALHYIGDKISNDEEFKYFNILNFELVEKLKRRYYKEYVEKIVSKDKTKDNVIDFYKTMLKSNVLLDIFSSSYYTINEVKSIDRSLEIFDLKTKKILSEKIKTIIEKNIHNSVKLFNEFVSCKEQKEKMDNLLEKNNLNKDTFIQFVLKNKYFDKTQKTSLLSIIFQIYDVSKVVRVSDIFELLDEMESREITIDEILKEKEIDKKYFYKIYEEAKTNNPLLFNYIKDSLELNKIRGFKKFISRGYTILNSKFKLLSEYESFYDINIYEFIENYSGTELYEKLLNKFSTIDGFDIEYLENKKKIKI